MTRLLDYMSRKVDAALARHWMSVQTMPAPERPDPIVVEAEKIAYGWRR